MRAKPIRWKRWLTATAGLLAAYTATGFWLVPALIKDQIPKIGTTELARQASIGEVRFNPYTLRLQAQDLRLLEADGAPLFGLGQLDVELQWKSLIRRAWSFAEISVKSPSVNLTIAPDGRFNLAEVLAALASKPQEAPTDGALPRVIVERFAMEQGMLAMNDRQAGYRNSLTPINFTLNNFNTLPDQDSTYSFSAESELGGKLRWTGNMTVNPIRGSGELSLQGASLSELAVYLKRHTDIGVTAGRLDATLPFKFSYDDGKFNTEIAPARLALRDLAVSMAPLKVSADKLELQLQLSAKQAGSDFNLTIGEATLSLADLAFAGGAQTPFKLASLGFSQGALDLAAKTATLGRVYAQGGQIQLTRDRTGKLTILDLLPKFKAPGPVAAAPISSSGAPWVAIAKRVDLSQFGAAIEDQGSGVKVHLQDFALKLDNASSDLNKAVKFDAGLGVREGGQLSAQGRVVPASGALQSEVNVKQLALAPLQPLLSQYLKLKLAGGRVSAQGQLTTGSGQPKSPALRFAGGLDITGLVLNEEDGEPFARWKSVGARKLTASVAPNLLDIPELRVVEAHAKLMIENDRSLNAARLLVQPSATAKSQASAPAKSGHAQQDPFPVRIGRLRMLNAKLDFEDLSLRPQFGAKIYELNGVINGLSSRQDSHSQIELDGRVDEFGLARIRGELNPFAPRDNTDISVVFKNVDMVSASPYSMKFAGYRIAEGKISLDLQYKVRKSELEGDNKIVIDKLTLGERIDSPDALKLPLELAIAILKDNDGRIDLGLPITGNMDDPQFSYGAIVWKAIGNLLTKIVTAPFRALGSLFGLSGEKMETIEFDPGSAKLQPPEREKLNQLAQVLAKRTQLKLTLPGGYSEEADGAALRKLALRAEITRRAGIKIDAGESPGPLDHANPAVREALRSVYIERFGAAGFEKETKPAAPAQTPDASAVYQRLREQMELNQPLAADALTQLGADRTTAIIAALTQADIDPASVAVTAPEQVASSIDQPVALKLGLTAK